MSASAPKVFISYRREETAGHTGRLHDFLVGQLGEPNVFMDVGLAPGVDFVERITQAVGACHVLLVMIGPHWATISSPGETAPRLAEADDFVRLEVETALRRADVTVIPVLLAGARMPDPETLPPSLRPLTRINAIELSDSRWRYDADRLIDRLHDLLAGTTGVHEPARPTAPPAPAPAPAPTPAAPPWSRLLLEAVLVAGAAGLVGRALTELVENESPSGDREAILSLVLGRAETWAVVGAALAVWVALRRGDPAAVSPSLVLGLVVGALAGALGALAYGLPWYLPEPQFSADVRDLLSDAGYAVTGALIGALVAGVWTARRVAVGVTAGAVGGGLSQASIHGLGWSLESGADQVIAGGYRCALTVGVVVAALLALDAAEAARRRAG